MPAGMDDIGDSDMELNEVLSSFGDINFEPSEGRLVCEKCRRPAKTCWCSSLPSEPIDVMTTVYILQHPYEETRNLQTAVMLKLGLNNDKCHILKGKRFSLKRHPGLAAAVADPNTLLMWPGPGADDLRSYGAAQSRQVVSHTLIVLDGTWHQARGIFNQNAFLQTLKQVQLTNTGVSSYVIRTQPTNECLSTVETVALAIELLENRPDVYQALMRPLRLLCDHQLNHGAVIHHSKQFLIDNGLYVKQPLKPTDVKRKRHRPRRRIFSSSACCKQSMADETPSANVATEEPSKNERHEDN